MRAYFEVNRIYKDSTHSKVSGVCAGLAKHWNVPRLLVRLGAIACMISLPTLTAIAYITATFLLPNK